MDNFNKKYFETTPHAQINEPEEYSADEDYVQKEAFRLRNWQSYFRFYRKKWTAVLREKMKKNFNNIIYLTLQCPPFTPSCANFDSPADFILNMRKQYPENDIRVLIPIINIDEAYKLSKKLTLNIDGNTFAPERTSISFNFFFRNKNYEAFLFKYPKDNSNIQVYGLFSPAFSHCSSVHQMSEFHYISAFVKAADICIKKLSADNFTPDIIHSENIPYFTGTEFDKKFPFGARVLQVVDDMIFNENSGIDLFWAAVNLADKGSMKRICSDNIIKKEILALFNPNNSKQQLKLRDCLEGIYQNYDRFKQYVNQSEKDSDDNTFSVLNSRIAQLFPSLANQGNFYNPWITSIKRCSHWAVTSKKYYESIFSDPQSDGELFKLAEKFKNKSSYLNFKLSAPASFDESEIYHEFNTRNFREQRGKNKPLLLKEFSIDRIKTDFVDSALFKENGADIYGYLDSFYEAPLLMANLEGDIFENGIDILFDTVLRLFELQKNIQVIICINDGMKNNFIRSWIDFLSANRYLNGRWVFVDGEINPQKFYASTDIIMIPRRKNIHTGEHFLALHYGCIPVASRVGILDDTISDIYDDINYGCGLKTKKPLLSKDESVELFTNAVVKALNLYQNNPSSWNMLIKNAMNNDSDWKFKDLERYNNIYKELI